MGKPRKELGLLPKIVIMVIVAELAGVVGSFFTLPAIATWYEGLVKPWFTPPAWVFGPAWTILYALMGTAAALVWHEGTKMERRKRASSSHALALYWMQLALNVLWSIIFFGLRAPFYALASIVVLWIAVALTIRAFYPISKNAAMLLVPYILWVTFATALNAAVWLLNA